MDESTRGDRPVPADDDAAEPREWNARPRPRPPTDGEGAECRAGTPTHSSARVPEDERPQPSAGPAGEHASQARLTDPAALPTQQESPAENHSETQQHSFARDASVSLEQAQGPNLPSEMAEAADAAAPAFDNAPEIAGAPPDAAPTVEVPPAREPAEETGGASAHAREREQHFETPKAAPEPDETECAAPPHELGTIAIESSSPGPPSEEPDESLDQALPVVVDGVPEVEAPVQSVSGAQEHGDGPEVASATGSAEEPAELKEQCPSQDTDLLEPETGELEPAQSPGSSAHPEEENTAAEALQGRKEHLIAPVGEDEGPARGPKAGTEEPAETSEQISPPELREDQIWAGPEAPASDSVWSSSEDARSASESSALSNARPMVLTPVEPIVMPARASIPAIPSEPFFAVRPSASSQSWWASLPVPSRESVAGSGGVLRTAVRALGTIAIALTVALFFIIILYRWVDPPTSTLMLGQRLTGTEIDQRWRPLNRISPHLMQAVILSEDGGFCRHSGVDWSALEEAIESSRGGSTITMQVVKNLFLWPARSYIRKALEIALAYVVEVFWSKERILEIYLNIAEWGPGIFGAEAAARHHFGKAASQLTAQEAALLAVSLPNPLERQAGFPGWQTRRLANNLLIRMRSVRTPVRCVRTRRAA